MPIGSVEVSAFTIPTATPESDGTLEWRSTTLVVVELTAGNQRGFGYTYADSATAHFISRRLADVVHGLDALDVGAAWSAMRQSIRNLGRPGVGSMAMAAVDTALWDLKARLLGVPLAKLFGMGRPSIPVYRSGGFTSYTFAPPARPSARRRSSSSMPTGPTVANRPFGSRRIYGVTWFEEPVSSDDLEGLRLLRDRAPAGMEITAGEYGYDLVYFRRMLEAGAVDVLQPDATRCAGVIEFLRVSALCEAHHTPLSSHTAPRFIFPSVVQRTRRVISNTSSTMCASRRCCSTASRSRSAAKCVPISPAPASASNSNARTRSALKLRSRKARRGR